MDKKTRPLTLILTLLMIGLASKAAAQTVHQPATVVELYTSQGCNSCPPADRFLADLAMNRNVLALSFNVTYWDYIGWKDTLASKDFDNRQTFYRDQLKARYVYTPQMVIAGVMHEVGSDRSAVKKAVKSVQGHARSVLLDWSVEGSQMVVTLPRGVGDAVIWLFHLDRKHDVSVKRGENSGKKLSYHNVVRKIAHLGNWDGTPARLTLDLEMIRALGRDGCALVVQKKGYGDIVAALEIRL